MAEMAEKSGQTKIDDPAVRQRIGETVKIVVPLAAVLVLHLCLFMGTGYGIPCVFRLLTGRLCPGCGMTHAVAALLGGDIRGAMECNGLCLTVLPVIALYLIRRTVLYIKSGAENFRAWEYVLLIFLLVLTVGYGVIRN